MLRQCGIFLAAVFLVATTWAIEIPKASGKALGITKGRPFSAGLVFVNGHYLPPPYVVERWGVGIRINGTPVIGSVISWNEFLKTQASATPSGEATSSPSAAAEVEMREVEVEVEVEVEDEGASSASSEEESLDDLFDDDPAPKKKSAKKKTIKKKVKKLVPVRKNASVAEAVSAASSFTPNAASKALVQKINKVRTEINATLISGGFICFGDRYSRVTGDRRIAEELLAKLPEIQKNSETVDELISSVRAANLVYLTELLCQDLYQNKRDYLRLQQRRAKEQEDRKWRQLGLDGI